MGVVVPDALDDIRHAWFAMSHESPGTVTTPVWEIRKYGTAHRAFHFIARDQRECTAAHKKRSAHFIAQLHILETGSIRII